VRGASEGSVAMCGAAGAPDPHVARLRAPWLHVARPVAMMPRVAQQKAPEPVVHQEDLL
jgi:hypothetical protein